VHRHARDRHTGARHEGGLLAVVPIVDSRDRLHAVLVIRDMHFMAFQQRNLDTLALLADYIGGRTRCASGSPIGSARTCSGPRGWG